MKKLAFIGASFALPVLAFAQTVDSVQSLAAFVINFINNIAVPLVFALAFIVFIWGVFQTFIVGATNDEAKKKGRQLMLWGLVGFFLMVSVWGLVRILTGTLNLNNSQPLFPQAQPVR
jgi:hypothetical protein